MDMAVKLTQERRNEIARRLVRDGRVSVLELSKGYAVSAETIRKDLMWLESRGIAQKSYGGAIAAAQALEKPFFEKATSQPEEKRRIGKAAAERIDPAGVVLIDSGSTVMEAARELAARGAFSFFTNSLRTALMLADRKCSVSMLGGAVRLSSQAASGMWAVEQLEQLHADWAIVGTSGFLDSDGPCVESPEEAQVKRAMIRSAHKTVIVADSTKSRCPAAIRFARWADISLLVTDGGMDPETLKRLRDMVEVLVV
jgi:DeoR/GlpR family transcriptional regulator of sugar metabolism